MQPDSEANNTEQLKGDARDFLNDKRAGQKDIEIPVAKTENQILVPKKETVQHQMNVSGGCNNQQGVAIGDIVDHVGVQEHNSETIAKALVTASQGDSRQQLNGNDVGNQGVTDARLNIEITAASKPIDLQLKIPIEKRMHLEIGL
ncbi:hypothetical protein R3W88_031964 [Solanum pinnatisectum]|uniref:Late embryogenesis abundant protein n=1 Tax=Solanum pinnatisectum TaxID=50273 RepID=A0AAV9LRQ1_9SOLN|nr:hypothetical protein R3W88_031964 [Solanum pinnatisectum]